MSGTKVESIYIQFSCRLLKGYATRWKRTLRKWVRKKHFYHQAADGILDTQQAGPVSGYLNWSEELPHSCWAKIIIVRWKHRIFVLQTAFRLGLLRWEIRTGILHLVTIFKYIACGQEGKWNRVYSRHCFTIEPFFAQCSMLLKTIIELKLNFWALWQSMRT